MGCLPITECPPDNCTGWNLYNIVDNPEHCLYDSSLVELNDIAGFPIEYRKLLADNDQLYGEDPNSNLSDALYTKMTFEPSDEVAILEMFGITADDTMSVINIPMTTFTRDLSGGYHDIDPNLKVYPEVGDVIKTLFNNKNYEIVNISEENNIHQGKKFVYTFILRPFRYSEQSPSFREVHTGLEDDPFATIVQTPSGNDVDQHNYSSVEYGDDEHIEEESEIIYSYDDVDTSQFGY